MDKRPKILLADDEPDLLDMYRQILEQLPSRPEIHTAASGARVIAMLEAEPFELLICDLKMPKRDGMAFYRSLVETVPALAKRVIFVTGDVAGTNAEQFLNDSGCRWLAKPFRLGDLLRAVREGLA